MTWARVDKLQVGDEATVYNGGYDSVPIQVVTVSEVQKLYVKCSNGTSYLRRTGDRKGHTGHRFSSPEHIRSTEPNDRAEIRERRLRNAVLDYDWRKAPVEILAKVYEVIKRDKSSDVDV